jgi:ankyrin repeat protein
MELCTEVCFLTSGDNLTVLDDKLQGQTAKTVKKALAAKFGTKVGSSRFTHRLYVEDSLHEIHEVLDPAPLKIQLVVLEFWPTADKETQKMISRSRENNSVALEQLLQLPRNPNEVDKDGKTPLFHAAMQGHVQPMGLLMDARTFSKDGHHWLLQFGTITSTPSVS